MAKVLLPFILAKKSEGGSLSSGRSRRAAHRPEGSNGRFVAVVSKDAW